MALLTNPATRLLNLVHRIESLDQKSRNQNGSMGWSKILPVEQGDTQKLFHYMSLIGKLPDEVDDEFRRIPELEHDLHLTWVNDARKVLNNPNLDNPLSAILNAFNQNAISLIRICESHLIRHRSVEELEIDSLKAIRHGASKLLNDIVSDDSIDDRIKSYLTKHLYLVIQSIDDYQIVGPQSVIQGIEASFGSAVFRKKLFHSAAKTKYGLPVRKVLTDFVLVAASIQGVKEIGADVKGAVNEYFDESTPYIVTDDTAILIESEVKIQESNTPPGQ